MNFNFSKIGNVVYLRRVIFVLFFVFSTFVYAQEPFHRKISFTEGLPTQVIYDLYIDKEGFLFMGSDKGLMSYDGSKFKVYPFLYNLAVSVNSIKEDPDGTIWCKNFSNQVFFLNTNGYLENYKPVANYFEANNDILTEFFPISGNEFWLVTSTKVIHFLKGTFHEVIKIDELKDYNTWADYNYTDKMLTVYSLEGITQINENKEVKVLNSFLGPKAGINVDHQIFYFIRANQVGLYSNQNVKFNTDVLPTSTFFNNLSYFNKQLWVCTSTGIYQADLKSAKLKDGFLKNNKVSDVVLDKEGNKWVSTLDEGLFMIPNQNVKRAVFQDYESNLFLLSLAKSTDNRVFAGDIRGKVHEFNENGQWVFTYDSKTTLEVENIFVDENKIFTSIGIFKRGVSQIEKNVFLGKSISKDFLGNFLIAGSNFAALVNPKIEKNPVFPSTAFGEKTKFVNQGYIRNILRLQRGLASHYSFTHQKYYVGFNDGLYVFDHFGNESEVLTKAGVKIIATDIKEDADGSLWISTSQNGLFKIFDTDVLKQITVHDGLLSAFCRKIEVDESGVWIATNEGVNFFSFLENKVYNVSALMTFYGLAINDILLVNNQIWLATSSGLIYFDKFKFQKQEIPNFKILRLKANKTKVLNQNKPLIVDYYKSRVHVDIEFNHYKSLGNFFIEYQLLPIDSSWNKQSSQQREITFLSLKPNDYQLNVRLRSGDQTSEISKTYFVVEKPFWLTYWFISLVVISLGFMIYFVYRLALQQSNAKQLIKEQLALTQLTALRSQMNPHFMFNVLNAVQGLIYSDQKTKANEYLGAFSDLMRKTLDVSDKKEISIADELETIKLYIELEQSRFNEQDFEVFYHLPVDKDLGSYLIPTLIIQPFVENAIKHGLLHKVGSKLLQITVEQKTMDYWVFVIEDNGVGRINSMKINQQIKKHMSFATKAISHRIQLINKLSLKPIKINTEDLVDSFNHAKGTRVTIWIPVKHVV